MGAKTLAYHISTALVILLFGFAGTVKITPAVSPDIHNEMVSTLDLSLCHTGNIIIDLTSHHNNLTGYTLYIFTLYSCPQRSKFLHGCHLSI